MMQQYFQLSFSLGPVSRKEGSFGFNVYGMVGVAANRYPLTYNPHSLWRGLIQNDMTLAAHKISHTAVISNLVAVGSPRRSAIIRGHMSLAIHYKQAGMINYFQLGDTQKKRNSVLMSVAPLSAGSKLRKSAQETMLLSSSGSKVRKSAQESIAPVSTGSKAHKGTIELLLLPMSHAKKQIILMINQVVQASGFKTRYGMTDTSRFAVAQIRPYTAIEARIPLGNRSVLHSAMPHPGQNQGLKKKALAHMAGEVREMGVRKILKLGVVEQPGLTGVKSKKPALITRELILASRAYTKSVLRDSFQFGSKGPKSSLVDNVTIRAQIKPRNARIETTLQGNKPPKGGRLSPELTLVRDVNSKTRPARLDTLDYKMEIKDSYTALFPKIQDHDPRMDLMIIPNRDFPYQDNLSKMMDANGVPYQALTDVTAPDVQVRYAVNHPFPTWAAIGNTEIWVNLWPLKDCIMQLIQIWRGAKMKLAGMTMLQGLNFLLTELYPMLAVSAGSDAVLLAEYYRVFRLARWFSERQVQKSSSIVLHRTYGQWNDKIYQVGSMNLPTSNYTLDGFMMDSRTGVLQSSSFVGTIKLTLTNYVNGEFFVSVSIPNASTPTTPSTPSGSTPTSTSLSIFLDGKLQRVFIPGDTIRIKLPVPAGTHQIQMDWNSQGGTAILSGLVLTGAVFQGATTTFEDPDTLKGAQAVHVLIGDLMKYYQDHWDQFKYKGNMVINQRKPWLST